MLGIDSIVKMKGIFVWKADFSFFSGFSKIRVLVILWGFYVFVCMIANMEFELKWLKMFWTCQFLCDLFSSPGPLKFATQQVISHYI